MTDRVATAAGELAKLGFSNTAAALKLIEALNESGIEISPRQIAAGADQNLTLRALAHLAVSIPNELRQACEKPDWLSRLVAVLGASYALNQHLMAHPHDILVLAGQPDERSVLTRLKEAIAKDDAISPQDRLRLANKRELLRIAGFDLSAPDPMTVVEEVGRQLAELADAIVMCALEIATNQIPGHETVRLGVVALGKCGGQELNYCSDVDVVFIAEPVEDQSASEAMQVATKIASLCARICSDHTSAGTIWPLDAALRPEGNAGPLVRSMSSMRAYYEKWAKNWEFQAMLKARPMAGDMALAKEFCQLVSQKVWQAGGQDNFMADVQAMRKRVIANIPTPQRGREIKLGAGGLRDVEFSVQLLQLVHGRADDRLRQPGTLPALRALTEHGYIGRADGAKLAEAYRFARVLEHRLQLSRLRRTHLMPTTETDLNLLARQINFDGDGKELWQHWRKSTREVLKLQQRVFYSPLLEAVSKVPTESLKLTEQAAEDRLRALGFGGPKAALKNIEALTTGVTRATEIQRHLMPAMLQWFSEGPNPDLGLLSFRTLSEDMGTTSWYLRALRDKDWMAERVAKILSSSRYVSKLLHRDAAMVQLLSDDSLLVPRSRDDLTSALVKAGMRHHESADSIAAIRALRRRELFRLAVGDILSMIDIQALGAGLSDLAAAVVEAALVIARREESAAGGSEIDSLPIGIIAMGRWGGGELSYASDIDAMAIVPDEADSQAIAAATRIVTRVRQMLRVPGADPALEIDLDLRPEGKNGPVVRTLSSYLNYYAKWGETWEAQALTRASFGAGDQAIVEQFLAKIADIRWPAEGISASQITQIRRMKARIETERAGRDARRNLKLGPGGLSDVEWVAQLLQMRYAGTNPKLRTTATITALKAAVDVGVLDANDAQSLIAAWKLASDLRNKSMLVRGRASALLPGDYRETEALAMLLGYGRGEASTLLEKWQHLSRLADEVVDRVFWGHN